MIEIWIKVKGYRGTYEVSNLGRVKSLRNNKERILKQSNKRAHPSVSLYNGNLQGPTQASKPIYQLVAEAFLGHNPKSRVLAIKHIDLNKLNNNVNNLKIVTDRKLTTRKANGSRSRYIGVTRCNTYKKWIARIWFDGKSTTLGSFNTQIDAARAYKEAIEKINGK